MRAMVHLWCESVRGSEIRETVVREKSKSHGVVYGERSVHEPNCDFQGKPKGRVDSCWDGRVRRSARYGKRGRFLKGGPSTFFSPPRCGGVVTSPHLEGYSTSELGWGLFGFRDGQGGIFRFRGEDSKRFSQKSSHRFGYSLEAQSDGEGPGKARNRNMYTFQTASF